MTALGAATPRASLLSGYAGLVSRPEVRRLVLGSMIARLPAAMLPLAILLLVHERTGSLAAAGLIVGAFGIGRAAVSPIVGAMVDRHGQARVLVVGAVAQGIVLVAFVVATVLGVALVITAIVGFAAGAATPPIQACLRALWPVVAAEPAAREAAYAFDATSQELIWIVGPLLVTLLLLVGSAAAAVVVCGLIGGAGVAMFASSPFSRAWRSARKVQRFMGALTGRDLRLLVLVSAFSGASWGLLSFGVAALAVDLHSSRASGLLLAGVSLGSITGGLLYGAWRWGIPTAVRYRFLLVMSVAAGLPLVLARSLGVAVPLGVLAGLPMAPAYASSYLLTGRAAPAGSTTEAFTWQSSAFALGVSVGMGLAGVAAQSVDVHAAFALSCLASAAGWFVARFIRDQAEAATPQASR